MAKIKLEDLKYVGPEVSEKMEEVVEEPASEVAEEPESEEIVQDNITPAVTEDVKSETIAVKGLRIYSRPSTGVPARTFTGNVIIIGHVDKFTIVKYVRSGFGLVQGYVIDSDIPRS